MSTWYYTFDTKNGNLVTCDTLIRPEFRQLLIDSVNARRTSLLTAKIAAINDTFKQHIHWNKVYDSAEDSTYYVDMKELYEECLERKEIDISFRLFYLNKEQLFIALDRCSAHVNRNLDELGDFGFYFNVSAWKKYFTDYALQLTQ